MVSLLNNILLDKCSVWCLFNYKLVQNLEFRFFVSFSRIRYGVEDCKFVCTVLCSESS